MTELVLDGSTLVYRTPYNPGLVAALKAAIPAVDRRWDAARRVWLVAPAHGATLQTLTRQYLFEDLHVPTLTVSAAVLERRILDVRYLGLAKERGDGGERTAFAWIAGEWAAVFTENVLRRWFGQETVSPATPQGETTLYGTLGLRRDADAPTVRAAYRRLARQWHPDTCHEPNAHEMFIRIQHSYEVLADAGKRARYDAGLALAAAAEQTQVEARRFAESLDNVTVGYRSPLRCGYVLVEGREQLGRFIVETILAWEDIVNADGAVLVSSWPMGAEAPLEAWV